MTGRVKEAQDWLDEMGRVTLHGPPSEELLRTAMRHVADLLEELEQGQDVKDLLDRCNAETLRAEKAEEQRDLAVKRAQGIALVKARAEKAERERDEAQAEIAAANRELERWRHGQPIEGDYVCPDSLRVHALQKQCNEARAEAAALREASKPVVSALRKAIRAVRDGDVAEVGVLLDVVGSDALEAWDAVEAERGGE
jgi:hypothetical protein